MPNLSNVNLLLTRHLKTKSEKARLRLFAKLTQKEIAGQIRQLREKRQLTQIQFAKLCKMGQPAVSRIEQATYSGWTYKTLARVAEKLNARLRIVYEPLEEVIARMNDDGESVAEISTDITDTRAIAEVGRVQETRKRNQDEETDLGQLHGYRNRKPDLTTISSPTETVGRNKRIQG